MIDKDNTSHADEIARILALGILRLRTRNKAKNSQKSVDFRANGSIHDPKENGREQ
jgi:hypothetical protein